MDREALHLAAMQGHVHVVKCLIEHGAQVDAKNKVRIDMYNMAHVYNLGQCVLIPLYSFENNVDWIIGEIVTLLQVCAHAVCHYNHVTCIAPKMRYFYFGSL